jgi:hypothetical protein
LLGKQLHSDGANHLSAFIAAYRYPPAIAELAVYPKEDNAYLEKMEMWEKEAVKVPEETREKFRKAMLQLLEKKSWVR